MNKKNILIAGGYGIVGEKISFLLAGRNPEWNIIIAGRNLNKAKQLSDKIPGSLPMVLDIENKDPLRELEIQPDLIIVSLNDINNHLFSSALKRKIPLLDITRWTKRVIEAENIYQSHASTSPVFISSGWMASLTSIIVSGFQEGEEPWKHVEIDILLSVNDISGPDSSLGFLNVSDQFPVWENGKKRTVKGFSEPKVVKFDKNGRTKTRRLNSSPEQMTLVKTNIAKGVSTRIAFDNSWINQTFSLLVNSGIWRILPLSIRKKMLVNTKVTSPSSHKILITLEKENYNKKIIVFSSLGQAHMTAVSAVLQAEQIIERVGNKERGLGFCFPENTLDTVQLIKELEENNVLIKEFSFK